MISLEIGGIMAAFTDTETQNSDLAYVRSIMKEPVLSREDELKLAQAWYEHKDEQALKQLIKCYSRLVVTAAVRFRHYGLPIGDLIQEGNVGLLYAAERFEPQRDVRFSTYARWWIRSSIQDYILRNWSIVRTGSTAPQKQLFFNLKRLRAQLAALSTDILSPEDREHIASVLNVTINDVEEMEHRTAAHDLSLNTYINDDGTESWGDNIPDERPSPENNVFEFHDEIIQKEWIESALHCLSPRERKVIVARRLSDTPFTLEAIGQHLNISKERVRQIERNAFNKLRTRLLNHLQDFKNTKA